MTPRFFIQSSTLVDFPSPKSDDTATVEISKVHEIDADLDCNRLIAQVGMRTQASIPIAIYDLNNPYNESATRRSNL